MTGELVGPARSWHSALSYSRRATPNAHQGYSLFGLRRNLPQKAIKHLSQICSTSFIGRLSTDILIDGRRAGGQRPQTTQSSSLMGSLGTDVVHTCSPLRPN